MVSPKGDHVLALAGGMVSPKGDHVLALARGLPLAVVGWVLRTHAAFSLAEP